MASQSDEAIDAAVDEVNKEFLSVLNDIAGTHAVAVLSVLQARGWFQGLIHKHSFSAESMFFMGVGGGGEQPSGLSYQRWPILGIPDHLVPDGPVIGELGRQWIVMVAAQWNDHFRKKLTEANQLPDGEQFNDVGLADITRMRNDVVHHRGLATEKNTGKCERFRWLSPGDVIAPTVNHVAEFMNYMGHVEALPRENDDVAWSQEEGPPEHLLTLLDYAWEIFKAAPDTQLDSDDPTRYLVSQIVARISEDYRAVLALLQQSFTQEASVLLKEMYEDVVIVHWVLLHQDQSDNLRERLHRQRAAIESVEADIEENGTVAQDDPCIAVIHEDWWKTSSETTITTMAEEVGAAPQFWGRTHGEQPILLEHLGRAARMWIQYGRDTAVAIDATEQRQGRFLRTAPPRARVLALAYDAFAMAACALIELEGTTPQDTPFWSIFMQGLQATTEAAQTERAAVEAE